ncbi:MAG TPA: NHL repeat-containing protein, partial [Bellilinea sp.]|nr:NHL repeat-containing protein [Bellilinea sp.]
DIVIDREDRLFVTDTGNKRVAIFDTEGNFIGQFGTAGMDNGQFDEQVGLAINSKGEILVADTWNQRIQVFSFDPATKTANFVRSWEVSAWYSNTIENKPFIAVDQNDNVFITDPEGYRVIEFNAEGTYLRSWGDYSAASDGFGLPSGIKVDANGAVWVSDGANNTILKFELPPLP